MYGSYFFAENRKTWKSRRSSIVWTVLVLYHMCLRLTLISFITHILFALSRLNKQHLNLLIDYIQSQSLLTHFISLDSTWIFLFSDLYSVNTYGTSNWHIPIAIPKNLQHFLQLLKLLINKILLWISDNYPYHYFLLNSRKWHVKNFSHVNLSFITIAGNLKFNVQLVMSVAGDCM